MWASDLNKLSTVVKIQYRQAYLDLNQHTLTKIVNQNPIIYSWAIFDEIKSINEGEFQNCAGL